MNCRDGPQVLAEWQSLYRKASPADRLQCFSHRTELGIPRSTAFKTTFQTSVVQPDDQVAEALQHIIENYIQTHVLGLMVTHAGKHRPHCVKLMCLCDASDFDDECASLAPDVTIAIAHDWY